MIVQKVPRDEVVVTWREMMPHIRRALRHGQGDDSAISEMLAGIMLGSKELYAARDDDGAVKAIIVLSHNIHLSGINIFVDLAAGSGMDEWVGEVERILREKKELHGALTVEASCRRGLAKRLLKRGHWKTRAIVMELN